MTENEILIKTPEEAIETIKSNMPTSGYQMLREALNMAITALKEVQQYREIGTVEECREAVEKQKHKKPQVHINNEDVKIGAILFRKGTKAYRCPVCNRLLIYGDKFCRDCGQAIQWGKNLEGAEECLN